MKTILQVLLVMALTGLAIPGTNANIYTVTSTVDNVTAAATAGTLRWAITQSNANAGKDSIYFSILPALNYFETSGVNSFAVIQLYDSLPAIRDSLLIDGSTQTKTNLFTIAGKTVGVDALTQAVFVCPDVYIVPAATFTFPNGSGTALASNQGTGLTIMSNYAIIKRLALSGFGNTNTNASSAQASACITVFANAIEVVASILIQDCFLGCDPMGVYPSLAYRQTKGQGILVEANRHNGIIRHNYIAWAGVNAINLNCAINTPASPLYPVIRRWTIEDNYIYHPSNNTTLLATSNVCDAASCLGTPRLTYQRNYIEDTYQTALDLGHNGDTSIVDNNTVTGTIRTVGVLPQAGIRVTASCRAVTLQKNLIYNNTTSTYTGGIYLDGVKTTITNATVYNTTNNLITLNIIHDNKGSGIVISALNSSGGVTTSNVISQNSTYNNAGLGIDLGLNNTASSNSITSVTINDNTDGDNGPNNLQNFAIIDSAKRVGNNVSVWGKAPAGATLEFFTCDGGINKFPSFTQNYGEGKDYLATGIEGSAADLASGTASYSDVDGNTAAGGGIASKFQFSFTLPAALANSIASIDSLTSTATVAGNTSEFGPQAIKFIVLACDLKSITGVYASKQTTLSWNAVCDKSFSYFDVEYSTDGVHYSTVGKVYADYNNNLAADYGFKHNNPDGYNNYYRLKLTDKNGNYRYSNTILIRLKVTDGIAIGPNPATDYVYVNITALKEDMAQLRMVNALGNVVLTKQERLLPGTNSFTLKDISRLLPGVYIIQVATGEDVKSQQVIIRR